jgi:hypothetical protein
MVYLILRELIAYFSYFGREISLASGHTGVPVTPLEVRLRGVENKRAPPGLQAMAPSKELA